MRTEIEGVLEIDHDSGIVYFTNKYGRNILRLTGLPQIPTLNQISTKSLDIRVENANVNYTLPRIELEEKPKKSIG